MSYLYDRKEKRQKTAVVSVVLVTLAVIFLLAVPAVRRGLKSFANSLGIPLWQASSYVTGDMLTTKKQLIVERDELKQKLETYSAEMLELENLRRENATLKGENPSDESSFIRAEILSKPSKSVYDVLVVAKGSDDGVAVGQKVFGTDAVMLGEVAEVFSKSARVKMYSTAGEKTDVVVLGSNVNAVAVGRGGQNFEMTFPRDVEITEGVQISLPGMANSVLAVAEKVLFDPRDPFQKVLLRSPLNVEHLLFVNIEK